MNKHIELVALIKSTLRVMGYTLMCVVGFALTVNVAYVFAHETPIDRDILLYEKCGTISKEVVGTTSYTRLRVVGVRDIADTTVFCILSGFKQTSHYIAPVQITVQYNWSKGKYTVSNSGL